MSNSTQVAASSAITPDLEIIEGQIITTSQQIAAHFGKRHDTVLRAVRNLECSDEYRLRNFAESSYLNVQGKEQPCYRLTRDGFVFLAMGFTGKEAAQWKEAYITAFNMMEQELLAKTTRPSNPAIDYDRISPDQAQNLKELVHAIVDAKVQGFAETWARLHKKFRVNSYLELPATRFAEARDYLLGKLPDKPQAPPAPDTSRTQAAFDAAAQAAAAVQKTVFNTVLSGNDEWKYGRWMLAFVDDSTKGSPAYARQMEQGAFVTTWPRLVKDVANGEAMCTSEELLQLASACIGRLEKRTAPAKLMG
jgi:Rha family phage regulatory protein